MTRSVVATFMDAQAARRAAVALGRAELAAGPTRVQVDASAPEHTARLELRVEESDAPRAIALMREHGAEVADREVERDLRTGTGPLAAWGMAVADAVTSAMDGATASDAQVPASDAAHGVIDSPDTASGPVREAPPSPGLSDPGSSAAGDVDRGSRAPVWGNAPTRGQAGTGSGTHLSDTVGAGTGSNMGQIGPGSSLSAAMGATDASGTARGTRTRADPETQARSDDVPMKDPRPPGRRPKSES